MRTNAFGTWLALLLCCAGFTDSTSAADRGVDEKAIRDQTEKLVAAFAAGNAKALAAFWTEDGEYTSNDGTVSGRAELEKVYTALFEKTPKVEVDVESASVRFVGRDTAIEEGRFHLGGKAGENKAIESAAFSILYVREDGQWKVALLRESHDAPALADLEWLVGSWRAKTEEATIDTTYTWSHGGTFLKMNYTVKTADRESSGTQMIGFDPVLGTPRSWLFTGEGGFGSGLWTKDGKGWRVESSGRSSDGGETASVNVLVPIDGDSFTWQATQRVVDGEEQPDSEKITVTRVKGSER